jgi:polar amino acid transport system permease protein
VHTFLHYLTFSYLYAGLLISLEISAVSFIASIVIGVVLAEARNSRYLVLRWISAFYVWVFRGTPILLQLLFIFDGLPSLGITLSPYNSAVIGFALNGGAFLCEIIRGALASVAQNQVLAAKSLGLSPWKTRVLVVLPQAVRAMIPTLGNELISLIKGTSIASVIAVTELTQRAEYISSQTFQYFPILSAAAIMYLAVTTAISVLQHWLERHFALEPPPPGRGTLFRRKSAASAVTGADPAASPWMA